MKSIDRILEGEDIKTVLESEEIAPEFIEAIQHYVDDRVDALCEALAHNFFEVNVSERDHRVAIYVELDSKVYSRLLTELKTNLENEFGLEYDYSQTSNTKPRLIQFFSKAE